MASALRSGDDRIVIIKKKRKSGHEAHHAGAWKVAYADFVTAMMAFFLLLWLLNVTTDEQKLGIADYFDPSNIARASSGSGGVLGGRTVSSPGQLTAPSSPLTLDVHLPGRPESVGDSDSIDRGSSDQRSDAQRAGTGYNVSNVGDLRGGATDRDRTGSASDRQHTGGPTEADLNAALAEREQQQFNQAEQQLRQAIQAVPDLQQLSQNLLIDQTPEGLRIQIVDQEGQSMFPIGSATMYERTRRLIALVSQVIARLPQRISISGHTDSTPFANGASYDNWDLSTDRANASRRAMVDGGVPQERISHVVGKAFADPLIPNDPRDARNRRISIVLLRETSPAGAAAAAAGPARAAAPAAPRAAPAPSASPSAPPSGR